MWLAPKLNHRIQICDPVQTPNNTTGSMDLTYSVLVTIWAEVKQASEYIQAIRGSQINEQGYSHKFTVRKVAVIPLGAEFDTGFSSGFKIDNDIHTLKTDYFIFLEKTNSVKGRRFKIKGFQEDEKSQEYVIIYADEIREEGTGYA